jgi:hypothetical protein
MADPGIHSEIDYTRKERMVQKALTQLTSEQQHVLALRFGQGYSIEETALFGEKYQCCKSPPIPRAGFASAPDRGGRIMNNLYDV